MTVNRSAMNGWYKNRYGPKNDLVPEWAILQQDFPYEKAKKTGEYYVEPVRLRQAHGVTFKGSASIGTSYTLNDPVSAEWKQLQIQGCEITLRDQIAYGAIAAAMGGDTSYGSIVDETVLGLDQSHRFYLEIGMLYGQTSIGTVESQSGSGATRAFVITKASWAPGLWSQAEKAKFDSYDTVGGTKLNTTQAIVVESIDADTRTINVSGATADLTATVATSVLVFYLSSAEMMTGFDKVITNTGTLHGISASTYSLWKGNTHSAGSSALTMGILHAAAMKPTVRGLRGALTFYVNTFSWGNLVDNENALRRYAEKNGKEYQTGADEVSFVSANGKMTIKHHPCVKAGEAFGISPEDWKRGGEIDLTDELDGENPNFFHEVPNSTAREYRNFSSQFFFSRRPSRSVKITNIVSPSL